LLEFPTKTGFQLLTSQQTVLANYAASSQ